MYLLDGSGREKKVGQPDKKKNREEKMRGGLLAFPANKSFSANLVTSWEDPFAV